MVSGFTVLHSYAASDPGAWKNQKAFISICITLKENLLKPLCPMLPPKTFYSLFSNLPEAPLPNTRHFGSSVPLFNLSCITATGRRFKY